MSTNSRIGKLLPDGRVKAITCHWDGYIAGGVGEDLYKHYGSEEKIDQLLDLGCLSSLGKEIGQKQQFNDPTQINRDWCLAYGRDRERQSPAVTVQSEEAYLVDLNWPYIYLFKEGEWFVLAPHKDTYHSGLQKLSSSFNIKEQDED